MLTLQKSKTISSHVSAKPAITLVSRMVPVFLFLGLSLFSAAEAAEGPYSLCKLSQEVRTLRVEKGEGKCQTLYNKYGKDQTVGEAQFASSCANVLDRVESRLKEAGWKCRSMKNSGTTDLTSGIQ